MIYSYVAKSTRLVVIPLIWYNGHRSSINFGGSSTVNFINQEADIFFSGGSSVSWTKKYDIIDDPLSVSGNATYEYVSKTNVDVYCQTLLIQTSVNSPYVRVENSKREQTHITFRVNATDNIIVNVGNIFIDCEQNVIQPVIIEQDEVEKLIQRDVNIVFPPIFSDDLVYGHEPKTVYPLGFTEFSSFEIEEDKNVT